MEIIHYRIPDAVKWLQMGTESSQFRTQKSELAESFKESQVKRGLREVGSRLLHFGKSTYAGFVQKNIENIEYILLSQQVEVHSLGRRRSLRYEDINRIFEGTKDHYTVVTPEDRLVIRPVAYLGAGRVRVPIGWNREGADVPYDLLIKELAAHCKLEIEYL